MKSVLNEANDVVIGDYILHYVNNDVSVVVKATERSVLNEFHSLDRNATYADALAIDPNRIASSVREHTGFGRNQGIGSVIVYPTGTASIVMEHPFASNPCDQPKVIKFERLHTFDGGYRREAYYTIDYGDGTPLGYKTSTSTSRGWEVPDFYHTYANFGTYTVVINSYANSSHTVLLASKSFSVTVNSAPACRMIYKESGWEYEYLGGTSYVGGKLVVEKVGGANYFKTRVVAYSKLVRETSPGVWNSFSGRLYTDLSCQAKTFDCTVFDHLIGTGSNNSANYQNVHRTAAVQAYWSQATSNHIYTDGSGSQGIKTITITPCN